MTNPDKKAATLRADSQSHGIILETGPFRVRVKTREQKFLETLHFFYGVAPQPSPQPVVDYDITISRPRLLRRWFRPQATFQVDGITPFEPQPLSHAFPMYEWGLNWCIATSAHRYVMLHCGSVAFNHHALLLPGTPGSGKSTLSAALVLRGGRLMSDEFGLLRPETVELAPMPRAIPLKNRSIDAILEFDMDAPLGPAYLKTRKGTVRHLKPGAVSLAEQFVAASPRWIVFPTYRPRAAERLVKLEKAEAFRRLALNCFNYQLLGETAFRAVANLVEQSDCYTLNFSDLEKATRTLLAVVHA